MTEQTEWYAYFVVGFMVPLAAFFLWNLNQKVRPYVIPGLMGIAAFILFYLQPDSNVMFRDFVVISAMTLVHYLLDWYFDSERDPKIMSKVFKFLTLLGLWLFVSRLLWFTRFKYWTTQSPISTAVLIAAFALSYFAFLESAKTKVSPRVEKILIGISVLIFTIFATRPDMSFLDASFFTGPVDLIWQGGWLFWDVPSQYGFLNIFLLSLIPADTSWFALYILNSIFVLACAFLFFHLCYQLGSGFLFWLFSTVLTILVVFLAPGWLPDLVGVNSLPSIGAFRFFWCYVLLFIVVKTVHKPQLCLRLGSIAWALGVLWSFENLIFVSVIWFAAAVDLVNWGWRRSLKMFAQAFSILILFLVLISGYYLIRLGHAPDFRAYYEFAFAYKGGIGALPINPAGAVWYLIIVYGILASALVLAVRTKSSQRPIVMASGALVWATSSYFIWRSHENQISNLGPLYLSALFATLYVTQHAGLKRFAHQLFIVVFSVLAVGTFGNVSHLGSYFESLVAPRTPETIHSRFPKPDPSLVQLLEGSGLEKSAPLAFFVRGPFFPNTHQAWLPYSPDALMSLLPIDRQLVYIKRWFERSPLRAGGIVRSTEFAESNEPLLKGIGFLTVNPKMLMPSLDESFKAVKEIKNDNWQILWFEPK
jgi:hypothetical protein